MRTYNCKKGNAYMLYADTECEKHNCFNDHIGEICVGNEHLYYVKSFDSENGIATTVSNLKFEVDTKNVECNRILVSLEKGWEKCYFIS